MPAALNLKDKLLSTVQKSQNSEISGKIRLLTPKQTPKPISIQLRIKSNNDKGLATATQSTAIAQSTA